ncbi:unnamed protein product, partial [Candidula unifasciata]
MSTANEKEDEATKPQDHWYLVDTHGQKFRLPKTMLFLGREECDVIVASQTVDKRHAVLTFDLYLNQFKVKDLSTTHGTFVNNSRIPEEEYVTLNHMDSVRLGQDILDQLHLHREQLPDSHYIPSWASQKLAPIRTHMHATSLAQCQGCMEYQTIEHTCCLKLEHKADKSGIQMACIAYREQNVQQHAPTKEDPVRILPDHHGGSTNIAMQTDSHVTPEICEKPGKLASEAHPAGSVQSMFMVTFDDSVCNTHSCTSKTLQDKSTGTSRNSHSS